MKSVIVIYNDMISRILYAVISHYSRNSRAVVFTSLVMNKRDINKKVLFLQKLYKLTIS